MFREGARLWVSFALILYIFAAQVYAQNQLWKI